MTTTLYRATRVRTMTAPAMGEWVLVDGRHVQRVGVGAPPRADRTVELPGTTVLPGFVDAHVHLTSTGLSLAEAEVEAAASADELLAIARRRAAGETGTVLLQGYDESTWLDPAVPRLAHLDAAASAPLIIRRTDGHVALANTVALAAAGVLDAEGVHRDDEGAPTGLVTGEANRRLIRWLTAERSAHRVEELQLAAAAEAAAAGITSVHEMAMPEEAGWDDVEVLLRHRTRLPVDVVTVVASMDVPRVLDLGLRAIGGDLPADGSIGARTAALAAPYVDGGEGAVAYADDVLAAFFHDGHDAGLQVGVHAIGDRAIEQVLGTWERVYGALDSRERRHFRARRHRIEHAEMASPTQVERAAVLGIAMSVQPAFDDRWGGPGRLYEQALGPDRAGAMNAFRTMLDRGVVVGAGSDAPVTPLDPWGAVAAMSAHHDPGQRLGRERALRVHTMGGAMLAHQEDKKGALQPGAHADLAAYDADPFVVDEVRGLRPILTVAQGREVSAR
ncbi:MAG TPA: amidohydrolase family protein [Actinomycetota bacterium]|nr:amidohydrolase family protein [Actinomycetota bacterium]